MSELDRPTAIKGRLVLDDAVVPGRIEVKGDRIVSVAADSTAANEPLLCPGFVDVHIHGWAGHDAMGGPTALDGMSRALLARGITAFLPTAVTAPSPLHTGTAIAATPGWFSSSRCDPITLWAEAPRMRAGP